ncbi:MAG: GNAT family N-acetyltransferase [Proteobacteria bacterium]|nr:GNAT family N-acetyltransferase [Pseudomonadota bacterium]
MRIRRLVHGEELALFEVFHSAIHRIACRDYSRAQINAWAPAQVDHDLWVARMRGINPFVAELEGEPVGYADVQASGYVDHFFVSGHHPRQGIGRALMATLVTEARHLRLSEMTSDVSRTAEPFFRRFGFEVVERRAPVVRGVAVPNALMRKAL